MKKSSLAEVKEQLERRESGRELGLELARDAARGVRFPFPSVSPSLSDSESFLSLHSVAAEITVCNQEIPVE